MAKKIPYCNPKATLRLQEALDNALELLAHIRYQNWPSGMSKALSVNADMFDKVLIEGDCVLRASFRKPPKHKISKEML